MILRKPENTSNCYLMTTDGLIILHKDDIPKNKEIKIIKNPVLKQSAKHYPFAPISAYIILNEVCNRKCKHCFHGEMSKDEMSLSIFEDILKELEKVGCFKVNISGGEIFLMKNISEYFEIMNKYNLYYSFVSNGDFINNSKIELLIKLGKNLDKILISLDGVNKKTHDIIRGNGSYDSSIKAIKMLVEQKIPTNISFTILKSNYSNALKLKELMGKLGVGVKYRSAIKTGTLVESGEYPTYEQYKYFTKKFTGKEIIGTKCFIGNKISFTQDGKFSPCLMVNNITGDESFYDYKGILDIWHNSPIFKRVREDKNIICQRY